MNDFPRILEELAFAYLRTSSEANVGPASPLNGAARHRLTTATSASRSRPREALAEQVRAPAGAVGASKARHVIGVSRGQFYNFRKKDPCLNELTFKMGGSDRDYWLFDELKEWVRKQQQKRK